MAEPLLTDREITRLHRLRLAGARVVRAAARGERLSRQLGAGQEFAAHRAYARGDDLRRVDWNVYGRLGQLFVKLFEAPGRLRVLVAIDNAPTMDFGASSKWLAARRAAAAAAIIALGGADRIWLGTLDSEPRAFEGSAESRILSALAELQVSARPARAAPAWMPLLASGGTDTVLLLFSDLQQVDVPLGLLRECARQGARAMCLCVHAPEELSPKMGGYARLNAPGHESLKLRIDARVIDAYKAEVARYREAAAHAAAATGATYLDISSDAPLDPFLAALSRRGLLASRHG
ncbi:MAG: DUF58 domain-containing protein [Planctomycetes bacterium]|nr:DUF58 domain-containing protein [Planctomycetota bacterium]